MVESAQELVARPQRISGATSREVGLERQPDPGPHVPDGIPAPERTAADLKAVTGAPEHGLFLGMAQSAIIAGPAGVEVRGSLD